MDQSATQSIRLLLVDDHAMFREGLASVLEKEPDFKIVGKCAGAREALELLPEVLPTMILLDFDLGTDRTAEFVSTAKRAGFAGQILVVTAGIREQEAIELIQAGVAGILHKHNTAEA